jgi:hypothetical protein
MAGLLDFCPKCAKNVWLKHRAYIKLEASYYEEVLNYFGFENYFILLEILLF